MLLEINGSSTLINCPGDTFIFSCGIQSNSEMIHLTWHITFPGHVPINHTFYEYEEDEYIESEMILTVLKNVTLNGTVLECSIAPNLDRDTIIVLINTSGN